MASLMSMPFELLQAILSHVGTSTELMLVHPHLRAVMEARRYHRMDMTLRVSIRPKHYPLEQHPRSRLPLLLRTIVARPNLAGLIQDLSLSSHVLHVEETDFIVSEARSVLSSLSSAEEKALQQLPEWKQLQDGSLDAYNTAVLRLCSPHKLSLRALYHAFAATLETRPATLLEELKIWDEGLPAMRLDRIMPNLKRLTLYMTEVPLLESRSISKLDLQGYCLQINTPHLVQLEFLGADDRRIHDYKSILQTIKMLEACKDSLEYLSIRLDSVDPKSGLTTAEVRGPPGSFASFSNLRFLRAPIEIIARPTKSNIPPNVEKLYLWDEPKIIEDFAVEDMLLEATDCVAGHLERFCEMVYENDSDGGIGVFSYATEIDIMQQVAAGVRCSPIGGYQLSPLDPPTDSTACLEVWRLWFVKPE